MKLFSLDDTSHTRCSSRTCLKYILIEFCNFDVRPTTQRKLDTVMADAFLMGAWGQSLTWRLKIVTKGGDDRRKA